MGCCRIYWPVHQLGFAPDGSNTFTAAHGVQSVGTNTTFNLEQVFELGQLEIYENIEDRPSIEVTSQKVLDGYCPLYLLGTQNATAADLAGRSVVKTSAGLSIFPPDQSAASGTPKSSVIMSGLQVSSLTYTFNATSNFTEDITLVGNNKVWDITAPFVFSGAFNNTDQPQSITGSGGVNRREDMLFDPTIIATGAGLDTNSHLADPNCTILPGGTFGGIPGITSSGTNPGDSDGSRRVCVNQITVSVNLGREEIFCLGKKNPTCRFLTFPTEVTTDIEVVSCSGDLIDATEDGVAGNGDNVRYKSIRVAIREGLRLNLGTKNKLRSVSYGGGSTGGENVTVTYSYSNFNSLTVQHPADVTAALRVNQL